MFNLSGSYFSSIELSFSEGCFSLNMCWLFLCSVSKQYQFWILISIVTQDFKSYWTTTGDCVHHSLGHCLYRCKELHGKTNRKRGRAGDEPGLRKFEVLFCKLTKSINHCSRPELNYAWINKSLKAETGPVSRAHELKCSASVTLIFFFHFPLFHSVLLVSLIFH